MRHMVLLTILTAAMTASWAQGTWTPRNGECPWYDRVGRYVIGELDDKYVSDTPVPQQACDEPRKLVLPAAGAGHVYIAISAKQSGQFAERLGLETTGDSFELMSPAGKKLGLTYDILIYRNPPKVTPFEGATAGIMLLSWEGDFQPPGATRASAKTYTPGERAWPWYDRMTGGTQWVMVDVPQGVRHDESVPQQSCETKGIVLPREGLAAVTIGVSDGDSGKLAAILKDRARDTGADFNIQAPGGGTKLPYSIFVLEQPEKETDFTGFGAGAVLLALNDMSADLAAASRVAEKPKEGKTGVLETEQEIIAQQWPFEPRERKVLMHVQEPPAGIDYNTGMMLCLHNWGGIYNEDAYIQWCKAFAERYNVVAVSVNYLQSGNTEPRVIGEKPYDHGYLQAMDCIRALYHIQKQLTGRGVMFNPRRCYSMGGSGGGNVSLMVNKLAPHTFACVVDICGMPGLTDGIAYGTGEYGSHLNAGYSQDPQSPAYLSEHMQQIRDPGEPEHLRIQFEANPANKVVIVHGVDDLSCPVVHKATIFRNMLAAGFKPDGHFLTPRDVDGVTFTTTGHPVGDRQKVVEQLADEYMKQDGKFALAVPDKNDFEREGKVVYPVAGGSYVVDYSAGAPTISFEQDAAQ